jgi:4-hydroxybenzoate polyprenyltransferase
MAGDTTARVRYLLALSRPRFWFYLAGPVVVGVVYGARSTAELFAPVSLGLFAFFVLPANVLLYGVNDVFDADVDEHNPKKDAEGREVRFTGDRWVVAALAAAGAAGVPLFATLPTLAVGWLALWYVLAVEYSAPPLRFKTTPVLDSLSNGLYAVPAVVAYAALRGANPPGLALAGALLWTMGMHTFSAVPDIEPDRAAGIRTTATVLGERRTYGYVGGCWLGAAAAFAAIDPRLGALFGVYPAFVAVVAGTAVAVDRAYWWFPALNTLAGTALTMGGLWGLLYG